MISWKYHTGPRGKKAHIQALVFALVCASKLVYAPKLIWALVSALVCAPVCAPKLICALVCAPKLACALVCEEEEKEEEEK